MDVSVTDTDPESSFDEPDELVEPVQLIETELLIEEISIDGMCGVY